MLFPPFTGFISPAGGVGGGGGGVSVAEVIIEERQPSGIDGGTFTSGSWQKRSLNTTVLDTQNISILASNQITLPAGTYDIDGYAGAALVGAHRCRLRDVVNNVTLLLGNWASTSTAAVSSSTSRFAGRLVLNQSTTMQLQHFCMVTAANTGFGGGGTFSPGDAELNIYAQVRFQKVL